MTEDTESAQQSTETPIPDEMMFTPEGNLTAIGWFETRRRLCSQLLIKKTRDEAQTPPGDNDKESWEEFVNKHRQEIENCAKTYPNPSDWNQADRAQTRVQRVRHDVDSGPFGGIMNLALIAATYPQAAEYIYQEMQNYPIENIRLTQRLLEHHRSRLKTPHFEVKKENPDPTDLEEIIHDIRVATSAQGETVIPEGKVNCRANEFSALLYNLLQNAKRAKSTETSIQIKAGEKGLKITVTDNGEGMSLKGTASLLEKLNGREEISPEEYRDEHGIGSANIGEIVKKRGGSVEIESTQRKEPQEEKPFGTKITITLPV